MTDPVSGSSHRRFETRAARLLVALASAGARLVPRTDDPENDFRLCAPGNANDGLAASATLVGSMLRRDWLRRGADGLAASEAGLAWLRRVRAADDPYRGQHLATVPAEIELADGGKAAARLVANESPLAWLRRRRGADGKPLVGDIQFAAGERLRADFERGCMGPRLTADWTKPARGRQRRGPTDTVAGLPASTFAARGRVEAALRDLGPELGTLLLDVCCFLTGLEDVERRRRWPRRSAKVVLAIALDRLAAHYGLSETARGGARTGRILHWGDEDYRPRIDAGTPS